MDSMYFGWLDRPVDVDKDVMLPEFTLEDVILYDCSQNFTSGIVTTMHTHKYTFTLSHTHTSTPFQLAINTQRDLHMMLFMS